MREGRREVGMGSGWGACVCVVVCRVGNDSGWCRRRLWVVWGVRGVCAVVMNGGGGRGGEWWWWWWWWAEGVVRSASKG